MVRRVNHNGREKRASPDRSQRKCQSNSMSPREKTPRKKKCREAQTWVDWSLIKCIWYQITNVRNQKLLDPASIIWVGLKMMDTHFQVANFLPNAYARMTQYSPEVWPAFYCLGYLISTGEILIAKLNLNPKYIKDESKLNFQDILVQKTQINFTYFYVRFIIIILFFFHIIMLNNKFKKPVCTVY